MIRPLVLAFLLVVACGTDDRSTSDAAAAPDPDATSPAVALSYQRHAFAAVYLEDHAAGVAWYEDVLGLSKQGDNWFGFADKSSVELFPGGTSSDEPKTPDEQSAVVALRVPDLDAAVTTLQARGIVFDEASRGEGGGEQWIYFADLEGNRLVLKQVGATEAGLSYLGIPWVGLWVERFEETMAWYTDVLGARRVAMGGTDPRWAHFLLEDGGYLEMFSGGRAAPEKKAAAQQSVTFGMLVPNLDDTVTELQRRGVAVDPDIQSWQIPDWPDERTTAVVDPEGNELTIREVTE